MRRQRNRGLSVLEGVVLALLIVAIGSLVVPALNRSRATARTVSCLSNLRQLGMLTMQFAANRNGQYPADQDVTVEASSGGTVAYSAYTNATWLSNIASNVSSVKGTADPYSGFPNSHFRRLALCPDALDDTPPGNTLATDLQALAGGSNTAWGPSPVLSNKAANGDWQYQYPNMGPWTSSFGMNAWIWGNSTGGSTGTGVTPYAVAALSGTINNNVTVNGSVGIKNSIQFNASNSEKQTYSAVYAGGSIKTSISGSAKITISSNNPSFTPVPVIPNATKLYNDLLTKYPSAPSPSGGVIDFSKSPVYRTSSTVGGTYTIIGTGTLLTSQAVSSPKFRTPTGSVATVNVISLQDVSIGSGGTYKGGLFAATNVSVGSGGTFTGCLVASGGDISVGSGFTVNYAPVDLEPKTSNLAKISSSVVPVYFDAGWVDAAPNSSDPAPKFSQMRAASVNLSGSGMDRLILNRHAMRNNVYFSDGSAKTVNTTDLWSLNWYTGYKAPATLPTFK